MRATFARAVTFVLMLSISAWTQQPASPAPTVQQDSASFDVNDASEILAQFREDLTAHSRHKLFALFDAEKMEGYRSFQGQMDSFFAQNDNIRLNLRDVQASSEDGNGVITATFEMETTPRYGNVTRRQAQLRFRLERSGKTWLIVDVNPRGFFS